MYYYLNTFEMLTCFESNFMYYSKIISKLVK